MAKAKTRKSPQTFVECQTDEERAEYLESHDVIASGEFEEIGLAEPPRLKLEHQLHMRLDKDTLQRMKRIAHRKHVGYQTLARMWLVERLEQEESQNDLR